MRAKHEMYTCKNKDVMMCVCVNVCMCMCVYVYVHVCVYVYVYVGGGRSSDLPGLQFNCEFYFLFSYPVCHKQLLHNKVSDDELMLRLKHGWLQFCNLCQ